MTKSVLTNLPEFSALKVHHEFLRGNRIRDLFKADTDRFKKFNVVQNGFLLDFSKRKINADTIRMLCDLAGACGLTEWRDKMFNGEVVNPTENRPALHTALRGSIDKSLTIDGENIAEFVNSTLGHMTEFTDRIRDRKKITDVVNIGIGGSDLGGRAACEALEPFRDGPRIHFIANIDGAAIMGLLAGLKPETTLFLVTSKSFTTIETSMNAAAARAWLDRNHQNPENQIIAITENAAAARGAGFRDENIFSMREWVGGRFSVWSAVGLPLMLAIGAEKFREFLAGAKAMDDHFKTAPLDKNIPVLMAMLGVWERNFENRPALAILPYAQGLRTFPGYMQQLDMESNGKSVDKQGRAVDYPTGPVIFGDVGTNAQHAFLQSFHQGTDIVPCDFIVIKTPEHGLHDHHLQLNANALAQSKAFMEGFDNLAEPHRNYSGDRPSNTIILDRLDPFHLGILMAAYEHKIFTQGIIWNINSFDQWGVERGKTLAQNIAKIFESGEASGLDSSTAGLLAALKKT
jgi:glucose-6-phosphate isomerase